MNASTLLEAVDLLNARVLYPWERPGTVVPGLLAAGCSSGAAEDLRLDLLEPLSHSVGRRHERQLEVDVAEVDVGRTVNLAEARHPVAPLGEAAVELLHLGVNQGLDERVPLLAGVRPVLDVVLPAAGLVGAPELVVAGKDGSRGHFGSFRSQKWWLPHIFWVQLRHCPVPLHSGQRIPRRISPEPPQQ